MAIKPKTTLTLNPTCELRWFSPHATHAPVLQQLWIGERRTIIKEMRMGKRGMLPRETVVGEVREWRALPLVWGETS